EANPYPTWIVHHCVACGQPFPLSQNQITDFQFTYSCDHSPIFAGSPRLHWAWLSVEQAIVMDLAELEVTARNRDVVRGDPRFGPWEICKCAHCGEKSAVGDADARLTGTTWCRLCVQNRKSLNPYSRASVILGFKGMINHAQAV